MTAPRDPDRLIRAFLAEGQTELPDRAYDAVRDSIDHTRQRVVIGSWREARMSNLVRIAIAAAAVLVVAVVGFNFLPRSTGNGGGPLPTPSLSPSPSPSPIVLPDMGNLESGTYFIEKADVTPARFTLSVPTGWETISYAIIGKTDAGANGPSAFHAALSPWLVLNVYPDPCNWSKGPANPAVGPTVEDLATALSQQVGRAGSAPSDVTLGGFSGKKVELSVPDAFDQTTCDGGDFKTWLNGGATGGYGGYVYGAGQRNTVYILDVNGKRFVLDTMYLPTATEADKAELQAIVDSIQFGP
jgi:hypothetical protein